MHHSVMQFVLFGIRVSYAKHRCSLRILRKSPALELLPPSPSQGFVAALLMRGIR